MNLNINYIKRLVKVLLLAQCFLLFCVHDKKEVVTTEQNKLNLADFVKRPFNEEFDDNTDLEKYVLKKFGKPDSIRKWRDILYDHSEVVADKIQLSYKKYSFVIYRGVFKKKKFEVFQRISVPDYIDLKHGINKETTIKDIERLFGKPEKIENIQRTEGYLGCDIYYCYYVYINKQYIHRYDLEIGFKNGKLDYLSVFVKMK